LLLFVSVYPLCAKIFFQLGITALSKDPLQQAQIGVHLATEWYSVECSLVAGYANRKSTRTNVDHSVFNILFIGHVKMKNWIYHHSNGFLNYTSGLSNSAILLVLPNAPRNLFPNY
jgi:hypothetical protein